VFGSRKRQSRWHGPGGNQDVSACQDGMADRHSSWPHKARAAVEALDARTGKVMLEE
jgi:uncharacterized membrane protein